MSEADPNKGRSRLIAAGKLVLGVGLVAAVLSWLGPKWSEVAALVTLRPGALMLGLAATTLASAVTSARWKVLAEGMGGTRLGYSVYFHAFVLTRVLGQFTSNLVMDTVGRGVALKSAGSRRGIGHSITPIVLERVFDLVLPVCVGAWALSVSNFDLHARADLLLAGTAVSFLLLAVPLLRPLARLAIWVYGFLARRRADFEPAELSVSPRLAAKVAALSLLRFAAVVLQFTAVAHAFGLEIEWRSMTAATPIAQISSLMGFTPGSLGFQEAGWALGLGWVGIGVPAITLFVLGQRVAVTSYFGLLSVLSWPFARRATDLRPGSGSATRSS